MPFIFSRRYIQRCLFALREKLTGEQYQSLLLRLNSRSSGRLAAMWEAIVLAHLSRLPDFEHELPLPDGKKPDFQFRVFENGFQRLFLRKSGVLVVGDITGVSDAGALKANPVGDFLDEFEKVVERHGSDMTQFAVKIGDTKIGKHPNRKVSLTLPRGPDRVRFFKGELKPYIKERLRLADYGNETKFDAGDYEIIVTFQPKSDYSTSSHLVFTSAVNIDKNPIWNSLKKKADQIKKAPENAIKLVVLCDCGCHIMRESEFTQNPNHIDIIREFLRRERGIDAVFALTEVTEQKVLQQSERRNDGQLIVSEKLRRLSTSNEAIIGGLETILADLLENLPISVSSVENASAYAGKYDYKVHGTGGVQMGIDKITISARDLHRLLAREITLEEFDANYSNGVGYRFTRELSKGSTISDVSLISCGEDADDDRLEFKFKPDAAHRPFE